MHPATRDWVTRRTWSGEAADVNELAATKSRDGLRFSVVIPAKDEAATIARVVHTVHGLCEGPEALVDELVVIDSDSTDDTAAAARAAGAKVFAASDIRPDLGSAPGKGEAMWKSLFVTSGDIVVFLDADVTNLTTAFVTRLLEPLLADAQIALVKGFYDRDLATHDGAKGAGQGGRVTELVARPLIALWWPQLAGVAQPLAGEWAARRSLLEQLSMPRGYGVEFAVLVDTYERLGLDAIAQVDLGPREHRHQDLLALSAMSTEIIAAAAARRGQAATTAPVEISHPTRDGSGLHWTSRSVNAAERPPASQA